MAPYYSDNVATLHRGDALAVIGALPDQCVDAVITDPPYSSGGMFRGDRAQDVHTKYVHTDSTSGQALLGFGGDNRDQRAYAYWCALWLAECLRVTRPGGVCALFTDWRQLPTTTDALQSGGWVWRGIVPWWKPAGRNTQGRFANNCEYVVWGTSGGRPLDASETLGGFFQANSPRDREHITQKPLSVMRQLVRIVNPGETILDPFMGSGTTGVAAVIERRRFVGVEMVPEHLTTARRRITTAALQAVDPSDQQALFGDMASAVG